jgi:hypothetical protein
LWRGWQNGYNYQYTDGGAGSYVDGTPDDVGDSAECFNFIGTPRAAASMTSSQIVDTHVNEDLAIIDCIGDGTLLHYKSP